MIRTLLGKKIPTSRWALSIGLGSSLVALGAANAQTPAAGTGETQEAERVIVTGSNIPTAAEVGAAPVTTIDAAAVGRTGQDDPQLVLEKSDPSFSGGGNIGQSNASTGSGSTNGGSAVSIRGLPTLVLLNGRRITDSAALSGGGAQFVDVNLFPAALIKRIEVLKDGASAIYGSDAVGGVVNVLLNDDFQGVAISGRYGFAEKGDIHDQRYSGVAGFGDDKTRIVVAGQYQEQDPIFNRQRSWAQSQANPFALLTNISSNFGGNVSIGVAAPSAPGAGDGADGSASLKTGIPTFVTGPAAGQTEISPGTILPGFNSPTPSITPGSIIVTDPTTGVTTFNRTQLTGTGVYKNGSNYLDLTKYLGITLDQNRTNAYGSFERDIFDKHLIVFGDFLYSKNYSQSYLAPQPVATNSASDIEQNMFIPYGSPYNPFASPIGFDQGALPAGTNIVVKNRFLDAPRIFRNDTEFYRIVAGIKGEIIKDYNYELGYNQSVDTINFKNFNLIRSDLLNEAIAGGYNADGSAHPATFNADGTVLSPAGAYAKLNGVLLPAIDPFAFNNPVATERAITGTDIRDQQSKLLVIDGKLTGFPVNLPAGPLGFAVGGEYRQENLRLNSSVENFVASVPAADIQVSRGIEAGYVELSVPVISPTMKIPGVYSFDLDGAFRYEKYDGQNSATTPKASFVYRPVLDVAVRGTFSSSFNAPNLFVTNGPPGTGFSNAVNLVGFNEQSNVFSNSNPNLGPSRADTYSTGIVISPHQVPGLTLSGDFFHVEERNVVTAFPTATILQDVQNEGTGSFYSQFVHVGSYTGPGVTGPGQIGGNTSNIFIVDIPGNNQNVRQSGVDFTLNYDHDFGPKFGGITLGCNGTYYLQYKQNDYKGERLYDAVGLYLGQADQVPQYRLVPYVEYRYGGASVSALMNYIPATRDAVSTDPETIHNNRTPGYATGPDAFSASNPNGVGPLPKIRDYYTVDMTLSYEFGLNKPTPGAPATSSKEGKDGKGGGDLSKDNSKEVAKKMMAINLLDGLKVTLGVNDITNAKPPLIPDSADSTNTDASIYDPYQRYFYFVVSKKF